MSTNPLYRELESARKHSQILDLIDTNFHSCGFYFPASILVKAYADYLAARHYDPHPKGSIGAREAISSYYCERGVPADPDRILITASTSEAYRLLFTVLCSPGDTIALPWPCYPLFDHLAQHQNLRVAYYPAIPERGFRIDVDALRERVPDTAKLLVLISPNNPTGLIADEETVRALLSFCEERKIALICDEVFAETAERHVPRPAAESPLPAPVFTLNGLSKLFASPDLKAAWILALGPGSAAFLSELELANDMYLSCSSPTQHLIPRMFAEGGTFRAELRSEICRRRAVLHDLLTDPPVGHVVRHYGGIHTLFGLDGPVPHADRRLEMDDEESAVLLLRRKRVFVHPGYLYGLEDTAYLVFSCLPPESRLREGITRFLQFLSDSI